MSYRQNNVLVLLLSLVSIAFIAFPASAEDHLGGHVGFVLPLLTNTDGKTTNITDHFSVGFPMGITVKTTDTLAFDLELVPSVDHSHVSLTVHPGLIVGIRPNLAAGIRAAFDVNQDSWGFTPLLNRSFSRGNGTAFFTEAVLPIRFQRTAAGRHVTSIGLGVHFGFGF